MYFDSGRAAWVGDSAQLDQDCADEVNRLFLMFSKAQDIHRQARKEADDAPILRVAALERVLERLRTVEVTIEMGEREKQRRIFLPLSREYRASAAELLEDLAGTYTRAVELLQEATGLMERVDELRTEVGTAASTAMAGVKFRADADLPSAHLEELSSAGQNAWLGGRSIAATDPRQAIEYLEHAAAHFAECTRIAELGNTAIRGVRELLPARRAAIESRIKGLRDGGYTVREPGFDPGRELERLTRVGQRIEEQLGEPDDQTANDTWFALVADLDALERRIDVTEQARDEVPKRLAELRKLHAENDARRPDGEAILAELAAHHAPAAYDHESDNLQETAQLRKLTEEGFASAEKAHASQYYLAATEDVQTLTEIIAHRHALLDELDTIIERLEAAKAETHELFEAADARFAEIRGMREGAKGVDTQLSNDIAQAESGLAVTKDLASNERPHWLELLHSATDLASIAGALRDETSREIEAFNDAVVRHARIEAECAELMAKARGETRDRPHVEAVITDAKKSIDAAGDALASVDTGGTEASLAVEAAEKWLDRARHAWRSELEAFQTAEADLVAAERRYDAVNGASYGYGAYADASSARSDLRRARKFAEQREWEKVSQLASASMVRINAAANAAQAEADRERRSREAAAAAAAAAARRRSSSYSSSSFSSSSSSSSFSSSSFSSSSSSGGSSFGSSSGGSSW